MSFREDGVAAVDWVASYLERLRELPGARAGRAGRAPRSRCPRAPPESAEPFADVLRDLDEILMPGLTHWQSPRFFAYFANTGSEPGVLAELLIAGLNQVGILWRTSPALQELEEVTLDWLAQLLGLPDGLHGHIEDTASTVHDGRARRRAAGEARRARRRLLRARALVGREGGRLLELELRLAPVDDAFRMRPDALDLDGRLRRRRDGRDDVDELGRSGRRDRRPRARPPASGCTSTPRTPAPRRSAPSCGTHFAGWERADSIVVNPHKWLLTPMDCSTLVDAPARRPARARSASSRSTSASARTW